MLNIYFNNRISNNSIVNQEDASSNFGISWDYLIDAYYCLIIYDIDIADCLVNLLAFNIQENNVTQSDILIGYIVPRVRTKKSHTFVVDVYKQRSKIRDFDDIKNMKLDERFCSKAENLILEANLELVYRTSFTVSANRD